jgi:hypothetical protein
MLERLRATGPAAQQAPAVGVGGGAAGAAPQHGAHGRVAPAAPAAYAAHRQQKAAKKAAKKARQAQAALAFAQMTAAQAQMNPRAQMGGPGAQMNPGAAALAQAAADAGADEGEDEQDDGDDDAVRAALLCAWLCSALRLALRLPQLCSAACARLSAVLVAVSSAGIFLIKTGQRPTFRPSPPRPTCLNTHTHAQGDDVYNEYVPAKVAEKHPNATQHPDPIVETASLAGMNAAECAASPRRFPLQTCHLDAVPACTPHPTCAPAPPFPPSSKTAGVQPPKIAYDLSHHLDVSGCACVQCGAVGHCPCSAY